MAIVPTRKNLWFAGGGRRDRNPCSPNFSEAPNRLTIALIALLLFDGAVLVAMFWDGLRTRARRVTVSRDPLHRLSIGRDNPISPESARLSIKPGYAFTNNYPVDFDGTPMPLVLDLPQGGTETVSYTVES